MPMLAPGCRVAKDLSSTESSEVIRAGVVGTAYEADQRPPSPDPARAAAHSDVILYFACEDVDAAYAYFRARGVAAKEPTVTFYGMKQVYLNDPDGYELCVQQPVDTPDAV